MSFWANKCSTRTFAASSVVASGRSPSRTMTLAVPAFRARAEETGFDTPLVGSRVAKRFCFGFTSPRRKVWQRECVGARVAGRERPSTLAQLPERRLRHNQSRHHRPAKGEEGSTVETPAVALTRDDFVGTNLLDCSDFVRCVDPNSVAALEHDPARLAVLLGEKLLGCARILARAGGPRIGVAGGPIRCQTIVAIERLPILRGGCFDEMRVVRG